MSYKIFVQLRLKNCLNTNPIKFQVKMEIDDESELVRIRVIDLRVPEDPSKKRKDDARKYI